MRTSFGGADKPLSLSLIASFGLSSSRLPNGAADEPPAGGRLRAEGWTVPFA